VRSQEEGNTRRVNLARALLILLLSIAVPGSATAAMLEGSHCSHETARRHDHKVLQTMIMVGADEMNSSDCAGDHVRAAPPQCDCTVKCTCSHHCTSSGMMGFAVTSYSPRRFERPLRIIGYAAALALGRGLLTEVFRPPNTERSPSAA